MKKRKGFSIIAVLVAIAVVAFGVLIGVAYNSKMEEKRREEEQTAQDDEKISKLNLQSILAPSEDNGMMGDNYFGSKDAKVSLYEYADYQCEYCAMFFPYVSDIIEEYAGKVNLVYRGMVLSYHKNGRAAATAANAAALQGYWHEYAVTLFKNQETWKTASGDNLNSLLESYFTTATKGKGDLEKFRSDRNSENVGKKIDFDGAVAKHVGIKATPTIYVGTEEFTFDTTDETEFKKALREKIDAALKDAK